MKEAERATFTLVDFHAEATSEKLAMGYYLDGRISALWGTHTHVQTADEQILPRGTGYLTDAGSPLKVFLAACGAATLWPAERVRCTVCCSRSRAVRGCARRWSGSVWQTPDKGRISVLCGRGGNG